VPRHTVCPSNKLPGAWHHYSKQQCLYSEQVLSQQGVSILHSFPPGSKTRCTTRIFVGLSFAPSAHLTPCLSLPSVPSGNRSRATPSASDKFCTAPLHAAAVSSSVWSLATSSGAEIQSVAAPPVLKTRFQVCTVISDKSPQGPSMIPRGLGFRVSQHDPPGFRVSQHDPPGAPGRKGRGALSASRSLDAGCRV